jgi:hypothetical protein
VSLKNARSVSAIAARSGAPDGITSTIVSEV